LLTRDGVYFAAIPERPNDYSIQFVNASGGKPGRIFSSDRPIDWFAVSPDRRWILYNQDKALDSDLMLVENFR
jgi:Tol biopolymer transport system component